MTEQEQIEIWRDEYLALLPSHDLYNVVELYGFCMAKRSQKVIELPKRGKGYYLDDMVNIDNVTQAIQEAGYQYTVKGEQHDK
mgnify:FL=1|jgi:hypothetical protein